jgi:alcohol dehydrogenase (NADP+)
MIHSHGYAALEQHGALVPFQFGRRDPQPNDLVIEVRYCGICHSDLHALDNEWGFHSYPLVAGHEIIGQVVRAGSAVSKFKPGDWAGIGTVIDSCRGCPPCKRGLQTYCKEGFTPTFGAPDRQGAMTYGGFSNNYVIDENYAVTIPAALEPAKAAPLLCAGITTFSPLNHAKLEPGQKVGIVGLGGLGHLAIKWARAWKAHVVVFSTTRAKTADAIRLGADEVVITSDADLLAPHRGTFRYILDTVSAPHDVSVYLDLLDLDGALCLTGMSAQPPTISPMLLAAGRRIVTSSMTGGIEETQAMLEFAARHGISADVEVVPAAAVNEAFERLRRNDVRYRFVLDMESK